MKNKLIYIFAVFAAAFLAVQPLCIKSVCAYSGIGLTLQYTMGGADGEYYIPESYYVNPVIKDINKDGRDEIIFANHAVCVLDAATGEIIWKVNGGSDRAAGYNTFNSVGFVGDMEVCDIDGDGWDEIVCGHAKGIVSVLGHDGYMKSGWPKQLRGERGFVYDTARSIDVSDLDNDGKCEIIVGASTEAAENVWLYDCYGNIMPGWPQLAQNQNALITYGLTHGYSYGVFMDGVRSGDITGDGIKEIAVATDTGYLCIYDIYGKLVPANQKIFGGRTWGKVALWEDVATETNMNFNEGWGFALTGNEDRSKLYKGELGHAVVKVCDVDGNGTNEVVTSAVMLDRNADSSSPATYVDSRYMGLFIFNADRTRYQNWQAAPSDRGTMGEPIVHDSASLAVGVQAEPVVCDLDNDGANEVIINTYDGCVHAFSVTNPYSEYGNFPYRIPQTDGSYENPNAVLCIDINGDGYKEVIFTTQTRDAKKTEHHNKKGGVYILDYKGSCVLSQQLPDGYLTYETQLPAYTNYSLSKPAAADVDRDGALELVVNSRYSGICVYNIDMSSPAAKAIANNTHIILDGAERNVPAYNINGYNYFKLRDIAALVNNTGAAFNISYNPLNSSVYIYPGEPYRFVGNEL